MIIRWQLVKKYWIWQLLLVNPFVVIIQFGQVECCLEEERVALFELQTYMKSYSNPISKSWFDHTDINCCKWSEVRCNMSTGRVTKLVLNSKVVRDDEESKKKPWLFNVTLLSPFSQLVSLDLSSNCINGFVDKHGSTNISTLKNLQALYLDSNNLGGGHISVSSLTSLRELSLVNASLNESSFPLYQELLYLRKLQGLVLDSNNFSGEIEGTWLCRLRNLEVLSLSSNKFRGGIPNCINNLTSIIELGLSYNNLEGIFPMHSLANLSKLQILLLSGNKNLQVQTEDVFWKPTFQLLWLELSESRLNEPHGTIPEFLLHQYNFGIIDLSSNSLVGSFPTWLLTNNSHLQFLYLENNSFSGNLQLPNHIKPLYNLTYMLISNNMISGELPKTIGYVFPKLVVLGLANNFFVGHIPSSISLLSNISILDMSNNNFSGEFPSRLFSNISSLEYLDLSYNNFQGDVMPHNNFTRNTLSSNLLYLHLSNNNLKGSMSDVLSKFSQLIKLDLANNHLTGNIPWWINKFQNLSILQLSGNQLQGHIPLQLCELANINILDISHNNLSGEVPACFRNISFGKISHYDSGYTLDKVNILAKNDYLTYSENSQEYMSALDLSCNKLTGLVPSELGELQHIRSLNLSHNYLSGPIPGSFSNLNQIESLDLSFNNLTSNIPYQLVELNTLEVLNVSFNNLSGRVPLTGQFGTFDESSYLENPGLFGFPGSDLHNQTQGLQPNSSLIEDGGDGDDGSFLVNFLWSFGVSCATMFLATIAIFYINPRWRQACFDFIDWYLLWWLPISWRSLY